MIEAFGRSGWRWLNEPRSWSTDGGMSAHTDPDTDYWRITHYDFIRDTGHLFAREVAGNFRLLTTFSGEYTHQYDQAGAMLRIDDRTWIKTGVELFNGELQASAVVTREVSDWSVVPIGRPHSVSLAVERIGDTVTVRYGLDGAAPETMLRLAYFPPDVPLLAGVMCASPDGPGCAIRFERLAIESV